jgi:hypothetical protein
VRFIEGRIVEKEVEKTAVFLRATVVGKRPFLLGEDNGLEINDIEVEELTPYWLNQARRKMVVLPHGIYTIIYKRRGCRGDEAVGHIEGSLQKEVSVNGRPVVRAVGFWQCSPGSA